jgi:hypothetical protein
VMQERKQFVVNCKDCRRVVPSGVKEFPFHSLEVTCPLCGELRRYLPSEVFFGRPDQLVTHRARRRVGSTQVVTDELPVVRSETRRSTWRLRCLTPYNLRNAD